MYICNTCLFLILSGVFTRRCQQCPPAQHADLCSATTGRASPPAATFVTLSSAALASGHATGVAFSTALPAALTRQFCSLAEYCIYTYLLSFF